MTVEIYLEKIVCGEFATRECVGVVPLQVIFARTPRWEVVAGPCLTEREVEVEVGKIAKEIGGFRYV